MLVVFKRALETGSQRWWLVRLAGVVCAEISRPLELPCLEGATLLFVCFFIETLL